MPGIFFRNPVVVWTTVWTFALLLATAHAHGAGESLSAQLIRDSADGKLDEFTLLEGALVAGGLEQPEQIEFLVGQFLDRCELDSTAIISARDDVDRVNAALSCLHQRFLTGE